MELQEAILKRRSIRRYLKRPVERELIEKVLESGTWAPSACDIQGWRFIVVESEERKQELIKQGVTKLRNIPVGIFVVYDNRTNNLEYQDHVQSAAAAIQNMLLTARSLGLGSCWFCNLPPKRRLRKMLNLPWNYDPMALVALGYPAESPKLAARKKDVSAVQCYDKFGLDESIPSRQAHRLRNAILSLYLKLPQNLQKLISDNLDKMRRFRKWAINRVARR